MGERKPRYVLVDPDGDQIHPADLVGERPSDEDLALALTNLAGFLDTIGPHQRNDEDEDYCYDAAQLIRDLTVWLAS